jgi:uncharacterized protein (TIGR04255 family)
VKYKKNYLSKVVLKFDFAPVPALMVDRKIPYTDDIAERFPNSSAAQAAQFQFTFGPTGSGIEQQQRGWIWTHANSSGKRTVVLSADSLSIEYGTDEYEDFKEFAATVEYALEAFQRRYAVAEFTRVGLRFIDEIDLGGGDPLDWNGFISPDLITSVKAGLPDGMKMTRSMHQVTFEANDFSVIFNYGLFNPDFPSPIARRLFVLDCDTYIAGGLAAADAMNRISKMNSTCERVFEASIGDELRELMGVVPE